jgi:hypothetical protein
MKELPAFRADADSHDDSRFRVELWRDILAGRNPVR